MRIAVADRVRYRIRFQIGANEQLLGLLDAKIGKHIDKSLA